MGSMKTAAVVVPLVGLFLFIGMWTTGLYNTCYKEIVDGDLTTPKQNWNRRGLEPGKPKDDRQTWARPSHNYSDVTKVFYNRVPKCGSRLMKVIIAQLEKKNPFQFCTNKNFGDAKEIRGETLLSFAAMFDKLPRPSLYERHTYFVDFPLMDAKQPTYINLVRDPIDRRVSAYYFIRFGRHGNDFAPILKLRRTEEERAQTFDYCVVNNLRECGINDVNHMMLTQYFCGQESICEKPSQAAVEVAKENIRRHYAVVGLLEEFSSFLKVLEIVMPQYFRGALATWQEIESKQAAIQQTRNKIPPTKETQEIMRQRMYLDYQVYDFIKERFHTQKKQLGIVD